MVASPLKIPPSNEYLNTLFYSISVYTSKTNQMLYYEIIDYSKLQDVVATVPTKLNNLKSLVNTDFEELVLVITLKKCRDFYKH